MRPERYRRRRGRCLFPQSLQHALRYPCILRRTSACFRFQSDAAPQCKNGKCDCDGAGPRDTENPHPARRCTARSISRALIQNGFAISTVPNATQVRELHATVNQVRMRRLLLSLCFIAGAMPLPAAPFPWWFHTRPKPVLIDKQPATPPPKPTHVAHNPQRIKPQPQNPPLSPKSWLAQIFSRGPK